MSFRVDAYPTDNFLGSVQQVRLQPAVVQNVVVYSTVIAVPNPQLKLKPGMTATVGIEIARRNNVLRVPTAAVRFRPTEPMFTVLNQPVPPEVLRGAGGFGGAAAGVTAVDVTAARARADGGGQVRTRCWTWWRGTRRAAPAGHTASPSGRRSRARTGAAGPGRTAPGWRRTSCRRRKRAAAVIAWRPTRAAARAAAAAPAADAASIRT